MILSIYFLNKDIIKNYFAVRRHDNSYKEEKISETVPEGIKKNNEPSKISLVETIEELGFIPSIENNNDSNAAWRTNIELDCYTEIDR